MKRETKQKPKTFGHSYRINETTKKEFDAACKKSKIKKSEVIRLLILYFINNVKNKKKQFK